MLTCSMILLFIDVRVFILSIIVEVTESFSFLVVTTFICFFLRKLLVEKGHGDVSFSPLPSV